MTMDLKLIIIFDLTEKKNYTNKHILKLIIVTIKMFSKNVEPNRLTQ